MKRAPSVLRVILEKILLKNFIRAILLEKKLTMLSCETSVRHLLDKGVPIVKRSFIKFITFVRHAYNLKLINKNRITFFYRIDLISNEFC
jgi:hypothetical protein